MGARAAGGAPTPYGTPQTPPNASPGQDPKSPFAAGGAMAPQHSPQGPPPMYGRPGGGQMPPPGNMPQINGQTPPAGGGWQEQINAMQRSPGSGMRGQIMPPPGNMPTPEAASPGGMLSNMLRGGRPQARQPQMPSQSRVEPTSAPNYGGGRGGPSKYSRMQRRR